jgi:hypothetical protein
MASQCKQEDTLCSITSESEMQILNKDGKGMATVAYALPDIISLLRNWASLISIKSIMASLLLFAIMFMVCDVVWGVVSVPASKMLVGVVVFVLFALACYMLCMVRDVRVSRVEQESGSDPVASSLVVAFNLKRLILCNNVVGIVCLIAAAGVLLSLIISQGKTEVDYGLYCMKFLLLMLGAVCLPSRDIPEMNDGTSWLHYAKSVGELLPLSEPGADREAIKSGSLGVILPVKAGNGVEHYWLSVSYLAKYENMMVSDELYSLAKNNVQVYMLADSKDTLPFSEANIIDNYHFPRHGVEVASLNDVVL